MATQIEVARSIGRAQVAVAGWARYAACGWGIAFAAVHLYWALGGTMGLPPGWSLRSNTPLLVIAVIAIPLCLGAAALALALVRPWGRRFPRWLLLSATWGVAALFVIHAAPALPDYVGLVLGRRAGALTPPDRFDLFLYEPWFLVGGIVFGLAAWGYQRRSRDGRSQGAPSRGEPTAPLAREA